jgi:hypothetical protein
MSRLVSETVLSASTSEVAPRSSRRLAGMIVTDLGVSSSGAVNS